MKKLVVLAVASLVATSANAAEMKWSGGADWRYSHLNNNDNRGSQQNGTTGRGTSEQTTKTHDIAANIGATGGWENVEWGVGIRTSGGTANDAHVKVQDNADVNLGLEQAWARYVRDFGSVDFSFTLGRQMNVIAYDSNTQALFDNDVRWNGAGWKFNFGMFGVNAAQYILGAKSAGTEQSSQQVYTDATEAVGTTNSKFNYVMAFQPYMNWKFSDEIETMFAVGYYLWSDSSETNTTNGGVTDYNTGTVNVAVNPVAFRMHNPKQWHIYNTWTLPYNLKFHGEYFWNKKQKYNDQTIATYGSFTNTPDADTSSLTLGLTYGSLKKAQDFTVGYSYVTKGLASSINKYASETIAADNKGHIFTAGYSLADNFNLGFIYQMLKERAKLHPTTGVALTNNQEMESNYWEMTAAVMF